MSDYDQAYDFLYQAGAHFVLAYRDGTRKRPSWDGWQHRRPALDVVQAHEASASGRLVGIIPWSLRRTVLDQDLGDPRQMLLFHPAELVLPSDRAGRNHLYYPDSAGRANGAWSAFGAGGEIRSAHGYVILYGAGPQLLADAVAANRLAQATFPADLFEWAGVPAPDGKSKSSRRPRTDAPVAVTGASVRGRRASLLASYPWRDGEIDLERIYPGVRNHALFDAVRFWAYVQHRGDSLADWVRRVRDHALEQNLRFPVPIKERNAEHTAYSIATWCWSQPYYISDWSSEAQARRGAASGAARRRRTADRDAFIRELAALGMSRRRIARAVEQEYPESAVSDRRISYIIQSEGGNRTLIRGGMRGAPGRLLV